jgi:hypothetical protein
MLHLLFSLLLQFGLMGSPTTTTQTTLTPTPASSTSTTLDGSIKLTTPATDVTVGTELGIGGGGWDDKN